MLAEKGGIEFLKFLLLCVYMCANKIINNNNNNQPTVPLMNVYIFAFLCGVTSAHVITKFKGFSANDTSQTCLNDEHMQPFNKQVRGVNLGGWLVLEPWITPSLFYQFLDTQRRFGDQAPAKTAMDSYTFCTALGKKEANKQMRLHWQKWVTEEDISKLARYGVNSLRVPVGDWTFAPYEPYIGCMDGALEELDRITVLAAKYDLDILLDIHAHRGSQNGFDNSGQGGSLTWTSQATTVPVGTTTFSHWTQRTAGWIGDWDPVHQNYSRINYDNIRHSVAAVEFAARRYKSNTAVMGELL
jgi:glucan 1,3-beta-glucosidase